MKIWTGQFNVCMGMGHVSKIWVLRW